MKQAIEFTNNIHPYLFVGSRRKIHYSYFLVVTTGSVLIRFGKQEHLVTKGNGFWLPVDCLHALTILPGSAFYKVAFSTRLNIDFCREAGFFVVTPLLDALLEELNKTPCAKHQWNEKEGRLLKVIADQVSQLSASTQSVSPSISKQYYNDLTSLMAGRKLSTHSAISSIEPILGISIKEFEACIMIREVVKLSRSGRKLKQIASQLNTTEEIITALSQPILGEVIK